MDNKYVLGIDIGGTKIRLGIVDSNGDVKWGTSKSNYNFDSVSEWINYFTNNILTQIPDEYTTSYTKIGIGTAGWIDEESNLIIHSPNTNWKNVDLKSLLEKEINIPISIINDCSAAVIGEHTYGAITDCTNALGIFIGTGIGGGIILNNNLYQGSQGFAGEIGHTIIVEDGNLCECGRKGCLEAYCGDMLELGETEHVEHQKIVDYMHENNLKGILVGALFNNTKTNFPKFRDTEELVNVIDKMNLTNHVILLKGSRGIKLEQIINLNLL